MREVEKAYLAGFLEADGCITIRKYRRDKRRRKDYYGGCVTIVNRNKDVLEWMQNITNCGRLRINRVNDRNPKWSNCYILTWNGNIGATIIKAIRPYLQMKHKQADLYCEMFNIKKNHMSQEQYNKAEQRYEEIKILVASLNRKGPKYLSNNGMNSGNPKSKDKAILSQVVGTPTEGAEITGEVKSS